jgi:hypothetical protein
MLDVRNFEKAKYIKKVHEQYGVKPEAAAMRIKSLYL